MANDEVEEDVEETEENLAGEARIRLYSVDTPGGGLREKILVTTNGDIVRVARAMLVEGIYMLKDKDEGEIDIAIREALDRVGS